MKKHPVDELFKSKLEGLEKKPSEAAWAKLEASAGMKKDNTKPAIWYAVAAALTLLLVSAGVIWNASRETVVSIENVAHVSTPAMHEDHRHMKIANDQNTIQIPKSADKTLSRKRGKYAVKQSFSQSENNPGQVYVQSENDVAIIARIEIQTPTQMVETKPLELNAHPVSILPIESPQEKGRTVLVSVEIPDPADSPKTKSGRFAKVFQQIKNARAGEKVDWEEVGFNPKVVIARIDDKLKHGEQELSERYQDLKGKTKL